MYQRENNQSKLKGFFTRAVYPESIEGLAQIYHQRWCSAKKILLVQRITLGFMLQDLGFAAMMR